MQSTLRLLATGWLLVVVGCSDLARDPDAARELWELSERTTEIRYP